MTFLRALLPLALLAAPASGAPLRSDSLLREHLWAQVRRLPRGERPTVGIALSAGAVRGIAHIGVLEVLNNVGFPIDVVAGTSMGAVIGALYAAGMDPDSLRSFPDDLTLSSGSNLNTVRLLTLMINDSLMSTKEAEKTVKKWIGDKRFDQIEKPFACVAMDIRTGEKIIFRDGPIGPAVRASMNLPGLFKPVLYRHRYLVDGGVVDFIPVDAAKLLGADWVIASVTEGDFTRSNPKSVFTTLQQIFDIRGKILSQQQKLQADSLIEPAVGDVTFYDVSRSREVMEKGMLAAQQSIAGAQESYILHALPQLWKRWVKRK